MNFETQLLWKIIYRNEWLQIRQGKVHLSSGGCRCRLGDIFKRIGWWKSFVNWRKKEKICSCPLFECSGWSESRAFVCCFSFLALASRSGRLTRLQLNQLVGEDVDSLLLFFMWVKQFGCDHLIAGLIKHLGLPKVNGHCRIVLRQLASIWLINFKHLLERKSCTYRESLHTKNCWQPM